ncbi:MAG: hypothetical protein ACPGGK_16120 [Pikeienuella sp.]
MAKRIIGLVLALIIAMVMLYISRFWPFDWWGREGLFGWDALRPGGDILRRDWLRGTMLRPYDLLIWVGAGYLILTLAQKGWDRLTGH